MKYCLLFCLFFFVNGVSAQSVSIQGKVTDSISGKAIPFASVFLSNASKSAQTDNNGDFKLSNVLPGQYQLVVSCIGFQKYTQTVLASKNIDLYTIKLKASVTELSAVQVKPQTAAYRKKLTDLFIKAFIGTSENASKCTLLNPNALQVSFDQESRTLEASASDFLLVKNMALGYQLRILLDEFSTNYNTRLVIYKGQFFYEELEGSAADVRRWKKARMRTYLGSIRHFYRSLYQKNLKRNGFDVHPVISEVNTERPPQALIDDKLKQFQQADSLYYWKQMQQLPETKYFAVRNKFLTEDSLIKPYSVPGLFKLSFNDHIYLVSKQKKTPVFNNPAATVLTLTEKYAVFDLNGILVNKGSIIYEGTAIEKIADQLPYDFIPDKEDQYIVPLKPSEADLVAGKKLRLYLEKVYLQTDRNLYGTGDDMWFSAYLVNAVNNYPSNNSNNLYAELISSDQKIIERKLIRISNGTGNGDFKLSDSLASGTYTLRAYTAWMGNFGNEFVFNKRIQIINTLSPQSNSAFIQEKNQTHSSSYPAANHYKQTFDKKPSAEISFFPEGGSLAEGLASRVAFKIVSAEGKGLMAKGAIVNTAGDTAARFESNEYGLGAFNFIPLAGVNYKAEVYISGMLPFIAEVPRARARGFAFNVQNKDDELAIVIETNHFNLKEKTQKPLALIIKRGGEISNASEVFLKSARAIVHIDKKLLQPGINTVTLYDSEKRPQCERLVYIEPANKVNLTLTLSKDSYQPKEKVTLKLTAADRDGRPVKARLSLAAADDTGTLEEGLHIQSYLTLQSEIRGFIENPAQYFDDNNLNAKKDLDLLLLTQGWRDFLWKRIQDSVITIKKLPEQGINISGTVKEKKTGQPLQNINITLRMAQGAGKFYAAQTDSAGKYRFNSLLFYGPQQITVTSRDGRGEPAGKISLDSMFQDTIPPVKETFSLIGNKIADSLKEKSQQFKIKRNLNSLTDTIQLAEVKVKARERVKLLEGSATEFGYPDENFKVNPKDYDYQDLRHYLLTVSSYTQVESSVKYVCTGEKEKHNDEENCTHLLEVKNFPGTCSCGFPLTAAGGRDRNRVLFRGDDSLIMPKIFINQRQLAIYDTDYEDVKDDLYQHYLTMPMKLIESVKIRKMIGITGVSSGTPKSGLVYLLYINTKPGALEYLQQDKAVSKIEGYYQPRIFYSPAYESSVQKPDFRTTIYWEPFISTDENGEAAVTFYNADPKGKIKIAAEGISENGAVLRGTAAYSIK